MSITVGLVGLGKMGLPIAKSLLANGFPVVGYRRHNTDDFMALGGIPATSSMEVAQRSNIVLTCLPSDEALLEVVAGEEGLIHGVHPDLIVVEISMLSLHAKEEAQRRLQEVQVPMLDCPISGTPLMVPPRKTVFFGSGDKDVFERCLPVFEGITSNNFYLGPFGAGSKMKCVANLLVAVHALAAAEAMVLSTRAGLDPEMVIKVINPSIAGSTMFAARAPLMVARRYDPLGSIDGIQECITIINQLSNEIGCPTPLLDTAARHYKEATAQGRGEQDIAAMFSYLGQKAGIEA